MTRRYQTTADVEARAARGEPQPRTSGWRRFLMIGYLSGGFALLLIVLALIFS